MATADPLALQQQNTALRSENAQISESLRKRSKDLADLNEDYKTLQAKHQESRKTVVDLSNKLQTSEAAELNWKLREQSYLQEASLLKGENDYLSSELTAKTTEFSAYRKEKSAQISSLEAELETALADISSLETVKDSLRTRTEKLAKDHEIALTKINSWQEKYAAAEDNFKNEMKSLQRLANLWERSTTEAKARIAELEDALQSRREEETQHIAGVEAIAEEQRERADAVEAKLASLEAELETQLAEREQLEKNIENLSAIAATAKQQAQQAPGTPIRNGASLEVTSPAIMFSPSARTISQFQKTGISLTELLTDFNKAKSQLEHERRRNKMIQQSFDDLVMDLESRAPIIQAEREEAARMKAEILDMSSLLDDIERDKEDLEKQKEELLIKVNTAGRDSRIYRQQVHDLSRQVTTLLAELQSYTTGVGPLSVAERAELRSLLESTASESESDTSTMISDRLVTYKNIMELQQQNQNLLRVSRELGEKLEQEEAESRSKMEGIEAAAVAAKQEKIEKLEAEIARVKTSMESYQRQTDSLRKVLEDKETTVVSAPISETVHAIEYTDDRVAKEEYDAIVAKYEESEKNLQELREQYNLYKTETTVDLKRLNSQLDETKDERLRMQQEVAHLRSKLELAGERLSVMSDNYDMTKRENETVLARSNQIQENLLKQDIKTEKVASELVELKMSVETLRNENANLNAEKKLFSSIQKRLTQDNEMLTEERNRNTNTISYLQNMLMEQQQNDAEDRKRLSAQTENLETELANARQKWDSANEELRNLHLQKQYEDSEFQKKFDKLTEDLTVAKELLSAAKIAEEQLKGNVDALTESLKISEEKASLYQRQIEEEGFSIAKNLEAEIATLTEALHNARAEREEAKDHVEQLTEVAKAAEEALASMNVAYDEYKVSAEQKAEETVAEISRLKTEITSLNQEVLSVNTELVKAQEEVVDTSRKLEDETKRLEAEVLALKATEETLEANVMMLQSSLRRQAGITAESQQNYEIELLKHADTTRDLQKLRADFSSLNAEMRDLVQEAENAKLVLATSETSWNERRGTYEEEIDRLRARCDDLIEQNNVLHEQIDNLSTQASRRRRQSVLSSEDTSDAGQSNDMQEVIKFVRHEKELVDAQYEVKLREIKSLQQRLEHTSSELDEVRAQLAQERENSSSARVADSAQYNDLVKKVEDINILRESNAALREESKRSAAKVVALEQKVQELEGMVQPLKDKLAEANAEVEARDARIKIVEEDNERWKNRSEHIMQAYQRVDPAELQQLKDDNAKCKVEVEQLTTAVEMASAERDAAKKELEERKLRLAEEMETAIKAKDVEVAAQLEAKQAEVTLQLEAKQAELERAVKTKEEEMSGLNAQIEALNAALTTKKEEAENWKARSDKFRDQFNERLKKLNERAKEKDKTIEAEQKKVEELKQQITKFEEQSVAALERITALEGEIEKKNVAIAAASLRAATVAPVPSPVPASGISSVESEAFEAEIAGLKATIVEVENKLAQQKHALEAAEHAKREAETALAKVKGELEGEVASVKKQLAEAQAAAKATEAQAVDAQAVSVAAASDTQASTVVDETAQKRIEELEAAVAKHEKSARETMIRSRLLEVTKAKAEQELGVLKATLALTKEELGKLRMSALRSPEASTTGAADPQTEATGTGAGASRIPTFGSTAAPAAVRGLQRPQISGISQITNALSASQIPHRRAGISGSGIPRAGGATAARSGLKGSEGSDSRASAEEPAPQGVKRQHEEEGSVSGTPGEREPEGEAGTEELLPTQPVALKRRREESQP
ncbi:uncharacterized protein V1518DRAFT_426812 [Limtongia smithiae]|uniref:uncharacterized protein n=1 Tax=Limtongia smithiae TaxID=1125753 RepID=UPI0034CFC2FD